MNEITSVISACNADSAASVHDALHKISQFDTSAIEETRVRVLRNYTLEQVEPFLKLQGFKRNMKVVPTFCDFNTFEQDILDPTSDTYQQNPKCIVLSIWLDNLLTGGNPLSFDVSEIATRVRGWIDTLKARSSASILLTSFLQPMSELDSIFSEVSTSSLVNKVAELNRVLLSEYASDSRVTLIDLSSLVMKVGKSRSFDDRFWYMYHLPYSEPFLNALSEKLTEVMHVSTRAAKKVLVLDCDNTLWGGIIGEDGLEGIKLTPHQYPGCVFFDVQRQALALKEQGVLLALCSKNNEQDALDVLDKHPECLIKREHLVAWQINWNDKATNIKELARILNLGLDSFVFIDDNPTECELIRQMLPEVDVLQVPKRLYEYPRLLKNYRAFDRVRLTEEDSSRTKMYQEEFKRDQAQKNFGSLDEFLKSLNLKVQVRPVESSDIDRVAQLILKTNQFNLTTKRYQQAEVESFLNNPDYKSYVLQVRDRFGDYGQTGVCIVKRNGNALEIDSFLMSCRVLGKSIEKAFLNLSVSNTLKTCRERVEIVRGYFKPTKKNGQVKEFFSACNFSKVGEAQESTVVFELSDPDRLPPVPDFIEVM